MMRERALARLPDAANNDGEFTIAARLWDGDVVLVSGDDAVHVTIREGRITAASATSAEAEPMAAPRSERTPAQIRIVGPADGWAKLLAAAPPPFYQDLFGAAARHGFQIEGAIEDVGPYYPAIRRLVELLRAD